MSAGPSLIVYHGCDVTTRDDLVSGRVKHLTHSNNQYDWLGPGAYFFERDIERAFLFAQASHRNPAKRYTAKPIATPAVVGAVLQVQNWLDMTTQAGIKEFSLAYHAFADGLSAAGKPVPVNRPADHTDTDVIYRALDNAVFTWMHKARESHTPPLALFQAVRAAFYQGERVAPTSEFHVNTHIQIDLRDNDCIVGWFLPAGAELLSELRYDEAKARLTDAVTKNKKPRVRVKV
ncbi:hypothetical protein [Massilia rubra]|uniref:DUF3990 domain-containing protein n=1 Tax=Massilia rubra TaxID=2607910 RepID=A0ABX0LQM5_9BURK|nr:hypothetical protein [Massilia rubra]